MIISSMCKYFLCVNIWELTPITSDLYDSFHSLPIVSKTFLLIVNVLLLLVAYNFIESYDKTDK